MPERPLYLRPHDVVVVLELVLSPEVSFAALARRTRVSVGEAHNAVKRLEKTQMLSRKGKRPDVPRLIDFLLHGVPNVFPGELGPEARGVPTAHSGPDLRERMAFEREVVWPSVRGGVRGQSLVPLVADASELAEENSDLYRLLALIDALRVGGRGNGSWRPRCSGGGSRGRGREVARRGRDGGQDRVGGPGAPARIFGRRSDRPVDHPHGRSPTRLAVRTARDEAGPMLWEAP